MLEFLAEVARVVDKILAVMPDHQDLIDIESHYHHESRKVDQS